jgi:3-isopropylmalate dehydrogenase
VTVERIYDVAVIRGDGIGPEVLDAALPAIEAAAALDRARLRWHDLPFGADHFLATGESLPADRLEWIRHDVHAVLLGALGDERIPTHDHARDILFGLRRGLDLFVNFRPALLLDQSLCPLRSPVDGRPRRIDIAIFRENTEGIYLGRGYTRDEGTDAEERVAEEVHTARGVRRILQAAFSWADERERRRVTMADKSNAVPAHRLWGQLFEEVGDAHPHLEREHRYVDALAMELVRDPERFDVIVTNNLLGDIISDLAAELVGGLGIAPSANLGVGTPGLFEPVHGSAPTIAGRNAANPLASILTGALMLEHLGLARGGAALEDACAASLGEIRTVDLGGTAACDELGGWVVEHVKAAGEAP